MPPEVLKLLHDIRQACGLIQQFTADKTADDFRDDAQLRSAIERQFITIGEALQQALRLPQVPAMAVRRNDQSARFGYLLAATCLAGFAAIS